MTKYIDSINDILNLYDVFILDQWGVMHDGSAPYDGVLETVAQLKAQNKRTSLVILSNSSKRLSYTHRMLKKLGFNIDDFEQIITSGEVSWRMMSGDDSLSCNVWPVMTDLIENSSFFAFLIFFYRLINNIWID